MNEILEQFDDRFGMYYDYADFCPKREAYHEFLSKAVKSVRNDTKEMVLNKVHEVFAEFPDPAIALPILEEYFWVPLKENN